MFVIAKPTSDVEFATIPDALAMHNLNHRVALAVQVREDCILHVFKNY